jgi:polysaccharide export outer membrane protein
MLAGCSIAPGPYLDPKRLQEPVATQPGPVYQIESITPSMILEQSQYEASLPPPDLPHASAVAGGAPYDYLVGPQDVLSVTIWGHPELSVASGGGGAAVNDATAGTSPSQDRPASGGADVSQSGQRVAADGTIFFPYLPRMHVAGRTTEQIRLMLTRALSKTIQKPQVDVRMLAYRSQQVQVTGDLKNPGPLSVTDVPMTIVSAINRSGGASNDADLQRVKLSRDGHIYTVDVDAVLDRGDVRQNILLKNGDIVNVPNRADSRVFVLGEVVKPTVMPMNKGHLTLADALAGVGSIDVKGSDPRLIYVIRGAREKPSQPQVFRLDMTQVDALLLMTKFQLQPLDVVYVGTATAARFNRVLEQLAPALQTLFYSVAIGIGR